MLCKIDIKQPEYIFSNDSDLGLCHSQREKKTPFNIYFCSDFEWYNTMSYFCADFEWYNTVSYFCRDFEWYNTMSYLVCSLLTQYCIMELSHVYSISTNEPYLFNIFSSIYLPMKKIRI